MNILLNTDSYKLSHSLQYPNGATHVSSYIEARSKEEVTLFFGLQAFIKKYLLQPFNRTDLYEAREIATTHGLPFNYDGWEYILEVHGGFLPIEIQAVPEGTVVPTGNVLVQIVNTDSRVPWLTSFLETALLRAVWYPTTVATTSYKIKKMLEGYYRGHVEDGWEEQIPFKLHDFGARGASSEETAAIGGLAHLVSFQGTDTLSAILAGRRFYHEPMAGFSIPAAEHSTITSWGPHREIDAYKNMVDQFAGPDKIYAVVSDSYNIYNAVDFLWGKKLKEHVLESGGQLVVRPDSGDPAEMVMFCLESLGKSFGYRINEWGYRVLNDSVRVIQGDGVNPEAIEQILKTMVTKMWSPENVAFGMGGALLQQVNRDTHKFAMKASAIKINGRWEDVYKDPISDQGKLSKRGRLALIQENGEFLTIREDSLFEETNLLEVVFKNGELLRDWSLSEVRKNSS